MTTLSRAYTPFLLLFLSLGVVQLADGKDLYALKAFLESFPRIPLGKVVVLMYLWSHRELRSTVARMLSLTRNTVGNVYAVMRHYCGRDLEDQPVAPFGGRVFVVKSDESQFRHKFKVRVLFSMNTEIQPPVETLNNVNEAR